MQVDGLAALLGAIVDAAIGTSSLLRERRQRPHLLFAWLAFNLAAWNVFRFLHIATSGSSFLYLLTLALAALIPVTALRFLHTFLDDPRRPPGGQQLVIAATGLCLMGLAYGAAFHPIHLYRG